MIVHSYARFSDPSQEGGDSLRRQREAAENFCDRKGWQLSDLKFTDKGRSGFKGNKQRALNAFLKAVDSGEVRAGETLLVEAVDRLSRKGVRATQNLVNRILDSGVDIAILVPVEKIYKANEMNDIGGAIELAAFAYQASVYSENLSNRIKAYNEVVRRKVRLGDEVVLSPVCPSWLEMSNGKFKKKPNAVKAIKYIFKRTIAGVGRKQLLRELNEKYPPISTRKNSKSWNETLVASLVKRRAVLGECKSTVTGETFKDYYPAIIDEKTWLKANAAAAARKNQRGPSTKSVNLFNGLLYHAIDGCTMNIYRFQQKRADGRVVRYARYKSYAAVHGIPGAHYETLHQENFEDMVFRLLPQLSLERVQEDPRAEMEAKALYLKSEIAELQQQILENSSASKVLGPVLTEFGTQLEEVESVLARTPRKNVKPTKAYRKKLSSMRRGTITERELVRDGIRSIVSKVWVLPIKMGPNRRDAVRSVVEVVFKTGEYVRAVEVEGGFVEIKGSSAKPSLRDQCLAGKALTLEDYTKICSLLAS